jgi:hypothetical protein
MNWLLPTENILLFFRLIKRMEANKLGAEKQKNETEEF